VVDYSRVMLCDSCFDRCPDKKENNCDHGKDGGRCDVCGGIDHNRMHCLGYCAPLNLKPTVEPRSIYAFGKRKSRVFDATLTIDGETFKATAKTKPEAIATVIADAEYVRTAGSIAVGGCRLYPQGAREWCFVLPSGGAMCFGAIDLSAALARVREDYRDHEGCQAFFASTEGRS
jgi:hypothetical protein